MILPTRARGITFHSPFLSKLTLTRAAPLLKDFTDKASPYQAESEREFPPYRINHTNIMHRTITVEWIEAKGLPSIENQRKLIRYPNEFPLILDTW